MGGGGCVVGVGVLVGRGGIGVSVLVGVDVGVGGVPEQFMSLRIKVWGVLQADWLSLASLDLT